MAEVQKEVGTWNCKRAAAKSQPRLRLHGNMSSAMLWSSKGDCANKVARLWMQDMYTEYLCIGLSCGLCKGRCLACRWGRL